MLMMKTTLKTKFIRYMIPSVLAQWVYTLYNMVDGIFVARGVNEIALTAVNMAFPFLTFLFAVSITFAVGTSTFAALRIGKNMEEESGRSSGKEKGVGEERGICKERGTGKGKGADKEKEIAGERDTASALFMQDIVVQLILSIVIVGICLPRIPDIAVLLGAKDQDIRMYLIEYLHWIVPFSGAFLLSYTFEILLKTDGYPRKAMQIVTTGAVLNIFLDWLFVIRLERGVAGAAFATSLSQITVTILYCVHFARAAGALHFCRFVPEPRMILKEAYNGFSAGINEFSAGLITVIFNHVITAFLTEQALVSYAMTSYINNIVICSITGISQGAQPLISTYYGRKDKESTNILKAYLFRASMLFGIISFLLCFFFGKEYILFYLKPEEEELIRYSLKVFREFTASFLFAGFNLATVGYFTAVVQSGKAFFISICRSLAMLCLSLLVLILILGGAGVFWAPLLSEMICMLFSVFLMKKKAGRLYDSTQD